MDMNYQHDELAIRDVDSERKGKGKLYTDEKRKACESDLKTGDLVLLKQKPENKLMPNFETNPYRVISKYGNAVTVENNNGVRYKRNSTHVKKFIEKLNTTQSGNNSFQSVNVPTSAHSDSVFDYNSLDDIIEDDSIVHFDNNGWYYLYHYNKEMVEEEWYETTRMVPKHTEKENVEKVYSHKHPFIRYFIRQSIKGGRVSANRKSFEMNKMDEICNILSEYSETLSDNIIDLFKEYSANPKDKTEVHSRLKKIKCTKLMAFDANGLYASAMSDLDSEYPKVKFRPRTAILKIWFEYPKNLFFQPIPAKDKITFTNRIGKKETGTKIRFRNGFCHDVLTSVDIQEIVKAGGRIIKILDGIVYEDNFKTAPYRDYILIFRDLRNKYKQEGNIVGSNCMKLLGNSLYGKSIQKDITTSRHLWSEATLKANFDSHVINYEKVNETQYIVEINEEEREFDCSPPKSTRLTLCHSGSFVLSHSKKIMNNFIHVIDGFYKPEIYYTDTDSLYISSSNWDKLNEGGLVSENDYCKGKNDYGDGGIIFGLYLAPKVKYNIILTSDGVLKEKKTFKGYSKDKISVEDYIRLANGHDVTNEFKKPWVKSFTNGVVIPKDDDKQKKVFRSYLNLVKRKAPDDEGMMYPYKDGKELNMDDNYEFDDCNYLTIQEENEEC
ncbi:hypothetical protein LOTGIDRAFT_170831 [Lottia gigantea]|uniref:DNA-directed DNA polymerase n=1 Tax=Lottia gigantea TaxID=225164 RepID=V4B2V9_LOTGI|nr:hypothetical protein LOTGIDRAFT_170831 [Lottia gigantea]ESP04438.1 hypothetical protein LOTGIDRAFT_170831 [Lottia gigantea]